MKDASTPGRVSGKAAGIQKLTKVTRPKVDGALVRERLFRLLDECKVPLVWISAPGGSGKTTLVSTYVESRNIPCLWYQVDSGDADPASFFHYLGLAGMHAAPHLDRPFPHLTPDYLLGIPEFSRNFFSDLANRLAGPALLVFDNCQQVENDALFYPALLEGMSRLPEDIRVLLISRFDPPPILARLRVHRRLKTIGRAELRMSKEEFLALAEASGVAPGESDVNSAYRRMDGWAAGLALTLEHLKMFRQTVNGFDQFAPEGIFDYFAGEIFAKLDSQTRQFLMKAALLPELSAPMAVQLTGNLQAADLLEHLYRHNHFTNRREDPAPTYQFHPLFRQFLQQQRQAEIPQDEIIALQRSAANLLVQTERFEPAVELLSASQDWEGLIGIILGQAQPLLQQGRNQTLAAWINRLPNEIMETVPWLSYWLGAARLPLAPLEALGHFERSFEQFTRQPDDGPGRILAWAGILEAIVYGSEDFHPLAKWLELIGDIVCSPSHLPEGPVGAKVAAAIFLAMVHQQPSRPDLAAWEKRALELIETTDDLFCKAQVLTQVIVLRGIRGRHADMLELHERAKALCQSPAAPDFANVSLFFAEIHLVLWGGKDPALVIDMAHHALAYSKKTGIHVLDVMFHGCGVLGAMRIGDLDVAEKLLDAMSRWCANARLNEKAFYHHMRGMFELNLGNLQNASWHSERSIELIRRSGFVHGHLMNYLLQAAILLKLGKVESCIKLLDAAESIIHSTGWHYYWIECDLFRAQCSFTLGAKKTGLEYLARAFGRSREMTLLMNGYIRPWMASLCSLALRNDIESDIVHIYIRQLKLEPDEPSAEVEQWPWPVKIYTLGRFKILRDGIPLRFEGKVQQRPLALLKAIIAMGAMGVSEARIADALWPDVDGDAAHQSLKSALHRLRKLLGIPEAIRYTEGTLSLEPRYCWTDVRALEQLLNPLRTGSTMSETEISALQSGLDLYQGTFLAEDEHEDWSIATREKLSSRFLHSAEILGDHLERAGRWEDAIERYLRALEVDPHIERFYQRLMLCYQQLERPAAALSAYERCRRVLGKALGIQPSRQTESIRQSILNKD